MVEMQFRYDHNSNIVDLSGQPALLSPDPDHRPKLLDLNDSASMSADSDLPQPNHLSYPITLQSNP